MNDKLLETSHIEAEMLLSSYLEKDEIDEECLKSDLKTLILRRQLKSDDIKIIKPESSITREHYLVKAPKIL